MAIVSTGQITIVDNNDARPITAYIVASNGVQQIYTKDESTVTSTPNWTTTPNTLTAKVYVGGPAGGVDVTSTLTSKRWSADSVSSTSLGSGTSLTINTNLDPFTAPQKVYFFEGDYTDPTTGLVSHVIAQISLSVVKTGTNAVYLLSRGNSAILESDTATKNVAVISVDLVRAAGVDTSGITYQFYESNGGTQITTAQSAKYGMKTILPANQPIGSSTDIGQNLPASGAWSTHNTLVIHESAVADIGVFRAVAKDAEDNSYQCYFTIYDVSDPYETKIISTAGDKLQNGVGSTNLYPQVYNGSTLLTVANTSAWSFVWTFFDGVTGTRAGFIDVTKTAVPGGRDITANTAGAGSVITYSGAAITFAAGDMVKIVKNGLAKYYEVASGTTNSNLTLRTATVSTFLNPTWAASSITANEFVGGKLFACSGNGATAGQKTSTGTGSANYITVTGDDIDGKGNIVVESIRP
jgi:hypothetical protein